MLRVCDYFLAVHVGVEGGGEEDGAVGLLAVFEEGDDEAGERDARAVEGVDEAGLAVGVAVFDAGAAGLEVFEVAA